MSKFGFTVEQEKEYVEGVRVPTGKWSVCLPHSCGEWMITRDDGYGSPLEHDEAVKELEQFISEAQRALKQLKKHKEMGDIW